MKFKVFLETLDSIFYSLYDLSDTIISIMFTSIVDILDPIMSDVQIKILITLGYDKITLFSIMFTAGIGVYIIYQLLKWILDIVL